LEKAVIALYYNVMWTNVHNKLKFWPDIDVCCLCFPRISAFCFRWWFSISCWTAISETSRLWNYCFGVSLPVEISCDQ